MSGGLQVCLGGPGPGVAYLPSPPHSWAELRHMATLNHSEECQIAVHPGGREDMVSNEHIAACARLFLEYVKQAASSGPSHLSFPLYGLFFPQMTSCLVPKVPSVSA